MVWIKDKPVLDGEWYWFRTKNIKPIPVYVCVDLFLCNGKFYSQRDKIFDNGEWSNRPISLPVEEEELKNEQY